MIHQEQSPARRACKHVVLFRGRQAPVAVLVILCKTLFQELDALTCQLHHL